MNEIDLSSTPNDPVFIVGNSRSGTTLMSRMLRLHSKVYILDETFMFDETSSYEKEFMSLTNDELKSILRRCITIQRKGYYNKDLIEDYNDDVNCVMNIYYQSDSKGYVNFLKSFYAYEASLNNKIIYGDQTPRHVFSIIWIVKMFPNCRIINMVRDPRAILLSQKNKWKASKKFKQPVFEVWRTRLNYHPFTVSLLWNKSIDASVAVKNLYSNGAMVTKTIIFEEFVENSECSMKEICEFIGINFEPAMLEVDVEMSSDASEEGKRGVSTTVANTWKKRLSVTEQIICEKTVGERLNMYDYKTCNNKLSIIGLAGWALLWPIHIIVVILMNMGRMGGNPVTFLISRLKPNK
jgi:omega-hydroxy-beta-dihydromenaquinone-9 sulfotransferase